jgi:peptide deformylase
MAILPILESPYQGLLINAVGVLGVSDLRQRLIDDMLETMYAAPGVGLAASQVNVQKRVIVIDVSEEKNAPLCLINPELLNLDGAEEMDEGCLSVPGVFEKVRRAQKIRVRALDRDGNPFETEADGLLAVCVQHEIDHLEGKLFVDYLSPLKRQLVRKKLKKEQRQRAAQGAGAKPAKAAGTAI